MNKIKMNGGELIIAFLKENGYDKVFGIPGRRILPLYDSAVKDGGVEMIITQHEEGAAFMADCYSRINGKGCCVGISGPGAINLLNGVASAYADSVPMLVFAGQAQVYNHGKYAIQEATGIGRTPDQFKMMEAVTKHACKVMSIEQLQNLLSEAYIAAHTGRKGPAYIELPTDILDQEILVDVATLSVELPNRKVALIPEKTINDTYELISKAQNPLILLGNGVHLSESEKEVEELITKLNIPFASTLLAKGAIDESQEGCLGCVGIWGQKGANEYLLNHCDLLVALGTSFQELSTLSWRTLENKKIVRVDIDKNEINRNVTPDIAICNDIKVFVSAMLDHVPNSDGTSDNSIALGKVKQLKEEFGYYETSDLSEYEKTGTKLQPYEALIQISKTRPKDSILVMDVGENTYFSEFLVKSYMPKTYLQNAGLGSMGFSVAGSVGAAFAQDNQEVIAITGDGGFLMNCNELATAAQYKQKVIWCVFNNSIRGTQKHYQRDFCDGRYVGADIPDVDLCKLANSFGVKSVKAENEIELRNEILNAVEGDESVLINIIIDENTKPIPPFMF